MRDSHFLHAAWEPLFSPTISHATAAHAFNHVCRWQAYGAAFQFLAGRPWGRSLLLGYPRLFRWAPAGLIHAHALLSKGRPAAVACTGRSVFVCHTACSVPCPACCSHGMFTHEGPSEQQMKEAVFHFTNVAKGYSKGEQGQG